METKDCTSFKVRKLDRLLARQYDTALAAANLKSTQFAMLRHIYRFGPISISDLAIKLGMDQSTLSRNIKLALEEGWVKITSGEDARTRIITNTAAGNKKHQAAKLLWESQQRNVIKVLGKNRTTELNKMIDEAIALIEFSRITK